MKFRYAFLICMVFLVILTIGFASASDNSTSTDRDISKETFEVNLDETVLGYQDLDVPCRANNSAGTFSDLSTEINGSTGQLNLTRNYTFSQGDSNYIDGIVIDKQITINGNGFTINGNGQARAFNITASNVILNNITFTNCCAQRGGAIYNHGTVTLNNDVFINNTAPNRAAAIFTEGNMVLNKTSFNNNVATRAGAITIASGDVDMYDVVFSNNSADFGGAIMTHGGFINLFHVVFINNSATVVGGAIYNFNVMNLYDVVFSNNTAHDGSAIINEYQMNLYDVVFSDNVAVTYGAVLNYNIMGLYGVVFSNNAGEYGGAIYNEYYMHVHDAVFSNNTGVYGGAINNANYLSIEDSVFANATSVYSPAIYMKNGQLSINNTRFVNLTANLTAGAISIKNGDNVHIENCEFINVSSLKNAGAIFADGCGNVVILGTIFRNTCSAFGGAFVQLEGNLILNNSQFINDFADFNGGAVYLAYVDAQINNCTFDSNAAGEFDDYGACGGAIYCDVGSLTLTDSKFINNSASQGSAVYACDSSYNITKSIFINNTNAIYTDFDLKGYLDENNICINSSVSTNNICYPAFGYGSGTELKLINNTIAVADIPTRFDLREWGWVTPVKNQDFKGFCWAFSIVACLESAILKATGVKYNFSENHLGNNAIKYGKYGCQLFDEGANEMIAIESVLSWFSLVMEENDCYDGRGKLSDFSGTLNDIHIQDVLFIPIKKSDDCILSNETNNLIKQALLKYGSVGLSFAGDGQYLEKEISIYHNDTYVANHAVAVVGWDDAYSRDNFDVAPPGDGAWIIKNSWGDECGDGGYQYLSYYDTSIFHRSRGNDPYTFAFIIENTENYTYNYQTDLIGDMQFHKGYTYYSNEYASIGDDLLGAVGTYFNDAGVEYEFKVYVNDELRLVQTGVSEFAGFRTIVLDKYIPLKTGDRFKIVFKSNAVPYHAYSRTHYLANVSMISRDGESWSFMNSDKTVCLKAYTVMDDTKIIDNKDITVDYAGGKYFTVRVVTGSGHAVGAGYVVNFNIGGKNLKAVTDENGVAKIEITEVPGAYEITVVCNNQTCKNNISVKLNQDACKISGNKNIKADYNGGKYFSVKIVSEDGKVVASGVSVKFTINGKSKTVITNKDGIAKIKITHVPKKYTITTTFNGKSVKNTVVVKQVLKAKNVIVKKTAKRFTLRATLKINGKWVKGKKITFKFKGKTYKVKTSKKGIAKVILKKNVIKKLKKGKTYTVKVTYIKDTIKTTVNIR